MCNIYKHVDPKLCKPSTKKPSTKPEMTVTVGSTKLDCLDPITLMWRVANLESVNFAVGTYTYNIGVWLVTSQTPSLVTLVVPGSLPCT